MSHFDKFSKNKLYNFLNPFIFKFLFFYFKTIFNLFKKAIQTILNLDSNHSSYKSNAPACMHNQVATPYDEF